MATSAGIITMQRWWWHMQHFFSSQLTKRCISNLADLLIWVNRESYASFSSRISQIFLRSALEQTWNEIETGFIFELQCKRRVLKAPKVRPTWTFPSKDLFWSFNIAISWNNLDVWPLLTSTSTEADSVVFLTAPFPRCFASNLNFRDAASCCALE